eukprot:gene26429-17529_t
MANLSGGDSLTITGTGCVINATVTIGGTACINVTVASATSLNCTAPAKPAGIYAVVVTNPDTGFSNATTVVVKYPSGPIASPPTVTFVTPVIQTKFLAGGDILTISGTWFVNSSTVIIEAAGFVDMALGGLANANVPTSSMAEAPAFANANAAFCSTITVVSNTTITCTAPAKSGGTYPVVVINPDLGYSLAFNVVVIYQSETPPTVTAVSPIFQANNLSGGDLLTITGTGFVRSATVSVGGTQCTNVTFVSATTLTCTAPSKLGGSYPIVVTNPDSGFSA